MKKIIFFTAAFCLVFSGVALANTDGRLGLGASYDSDVHIRKGLSNGNVVGGGISFSSTDQGEETNTDIGLRGEFEKNLKAGDHAQLNLLFALNLMLPEGATIITPMAGFRARVWMGNNFSVAASHGLAIELISPDEGDSLTNFGTFSQNITQVEFTYWMDN